MILGIAANLTAENFRKHLEENREKEEKEEKNVDEKDDALENDRDPQVEFILNDYNRIMEELDSTYLDSLCLISPTAEKKKASKISTELEKERERFMVSLIRLPVRIDLIPRNFSSNSKRRKSCASRNLNH